MEFRSYFSFKTIRFVVITILLGAFGSGAWEWLLKPFVMGASEFGLNIATLWMHSFKDSLYKEIARGLHEESSLRVYTAIFSFLPSFVLGVTMGVLRARKKTTFSGETTSFDRVMNKLGRPILVIFIFLLVFSVVQANQHAYVNRAITNFEQLLAVVGPHISEQDRMLYRSRFAQSASSEEYATLTSELRERCRVKNLRTPEFSVW